MADLSPKGLATGLLGILNNDEDRLNRIDDYLHGSHADPYMPPQADSEYRLLARRCVSNWMPLLVDTPAQALYVDGFRRGIEQSKSKTPEWKHWQDSRLDSRQLAIHRAALAYGHSFALTFKDKKGRFITKGLSTLRTAAYFEDAANDETPYAALNVTRWPDAENKSIGTAKLYTERYVYDVRFKDIKTVSIVNKVKHGFSECPVTRFTAHVDLEGRTLGVVEPMIELQDRVNQTVFDLLVAQTYGSFKVRTVTGMAPPIERDVETGEPVLDANGNPKAIPINHNVRRFLFAEDPDVNFGSLDETPLGGFIESIDMSIRHLSAISQTPPHHLLGQIANLSAEALQAAETALSRRIAEFRVSFGESWERIFRLVSEATGDASGADDFSGEVIWRDMESRSLAQSADALGKLKDQLGVPAKGLWKRIPNVTQTELEEWDEMAAGDDAQLALIESINRATADTAEVV